MFGIQTHSTLRYAAMRNHVDLNGEPHRQGRSMWWN